MTTPPGEATRRHHGADAEGPVAPQSRPPRWAAGHVLVAVLVGLGAGSLLNAHSLLAVAERQPFGWQRDVAVAVTQPLAEVSTWLRLDRPRRAIDLAMGRGGVAAEPEGSDEPVGAVRSDDAAPPTEAVPDPRPFRHGAAPWESEPGDEEPESRRTVSSDDPLSMYVGGDSMVGQFGMAMEDLGGRTGMITTTEVEYNFGSGLSRPDFMDWPARLAEVSADQDPDVLILFFGGNDAQPLELDGGVYEPEEPEWQAEYRARAAALMDQLSDDGHHVYWMGMPIPRSDDMVPKLEMLNDIYSSEAETRDAITFVPSWDLFSDADGNYSEYLEDDDGNLVDMRLNDGIHLTTAGAYRLARVTVERIVEDYEIEVVDD